MDSNDANLRKCVHLGDIKILWLTHAKKMTDAAGNYPVPPHIYMCCPVLPVLDPQFYTPSLCSCLGSASSFHMTAVVNSFSFQIEEVSKQNRFEKFQITYYQNS
jgi:hypothetical protein